MKIISALKDIIWGIPTLVLLTVLGIYFTAKCRFYTPKALRKTAKDLYSSLKTQTNGISPFSAVATALGGTVGIGSIVGVGYAISVGGAGSIFWMWVCSFFGMGLKYAEIKIALNRKNSKGKGGAPYRLADLGNKRLAVLFCVFCVFASFGTGNLTQTGAIASFLMGRGISPLTSGLICCFIIALAVFGSKKRIASINTFLVPAASVVYIVACLCIIILNPLGTANAFSVIIKNAFGFSSVAGGVSGAVLSRVIREGIVRSMFSSEAGMGSSPLAHGSTEGDITVQAEWGLFEIFFDTFVVSTLTALCMLGGGFTDVTQMFFAFFGRIGMWVIGGLLAIFAFASVISWCYYSRCCLDFLFPRSKTAERVYKAVFALAAMAGAYASDNLIWEISDILNALMLFPNLYLLFRCRNEIERII